MVLRHASPEKDMQNPEATCLLRSAGFPLRDSGARARIAGPMHKLLERAAPADRQLPRRVRPLEQLLHRAGNAFRHQVVATRVRMDLVALELRSVRMPASAPAIRWQPSSLATRSYISS